MKIVVLDGYTLNPGDLSWDELETLGDCTIYDRTAANKIVERSENAEVVLTNKTILNREILEQLTKLKYIGVLATGYNVVDTEAAQERGILVTNVPAYSTHSVAQMVFAHILNLTNQVHHHALTVKENRWTNSKDFCYWDFPLIELAGMTLGIIGFGRIGQAAARLGLAFRMNVLVNDVNLPEDLPSGIERAGLEEIFSRSDFLSLHCPLTPETENLVDAGKIGLMKKSAFLINTSRGPLIDEQALADALNSERIAGAGLDVLSVEPAEAANPLLSAKNCYITPHISWATLSARKRLMNTVVNNVKGFLTGNPVNVVNR